MIWRRRAKRRRHTRMSWDAAEAISSARWCARLSFPGAALGLFTAVIATLAATWALVETVIRRGDPWALPACLGVAVSSGLGGALLVMGRIRITEGIDRDRARILGGLAMCVGGNGLVLLPGAGVLVGGSGLASGQVLAIAVCLMTPLAVAPVVAVLLGLWGLLAHGPRYRALGRPWQGVSGRPRPITFSDPPPGASEGGAGAPEAPPA